MGKVRILWPSMRSFLRIAFTLFLVIRTVRPEIPEPIISRCVLEQIINSLRPSDDGFEMHKASLRNQLLNLLENNIYDNNNNYQLLDEDNVNDSDQFDDKRSINSLARNGLLTSGKRNIGSLARSGLLMRNHQFEDNNKRSVASLAKTGQLPSREPEAEISSSSTNWMDDKRNIGSLARSGNYFYTQGGKRNLAALVRTGMLPYVAKKNLASMARGNLLPRWMEEDRRSIGTLARDWALPNQKSNKFDSKRDTDKEFMLQKDAEKKNLGALKSSPVHGGRQKRQTNYNDFDEGGNMEIPEPVMQTSPIDYEELLDTLTNAYPSHNDDKRFLGSVARGGWFRNSYNGKDKRHVGSLARSFGLLRADTDNSRQTYLRQEDKRHIGALARSGWLPSFRPVRGGRFSRSGRARSQIAELYIPRDRLRQPIASVCRRCSPSFTNSISWGAPGLQSSWGTPPRLTALHWRSLRSSTEPSEFFY